MAVVKANINSFEEEVLKADKPVIVDFWAEWCGPCKMLSPVMEKVADENEEIKVVSINVDENMDLAQKYGVTSIPCLVVFKEGEEVNRSVGLIPQDQVEALVK